MVNTEKHFGKTWLANKYEKGAAGGAQDQLLAETRGEDTVYMQYHHSKGYRYGAFEALEAAELAMDGDHHMYEIIPKNAKRKF